VSFVSEDLEFYFQVLGLRLFILTPHLLLLYGKVQLGHSAKYLMLFLTELRISYKFGTKTMTE